MAQSVNLSPSRLCHLFKAETGVAPVHYLKALRMQAAKKYLETSFLSVKIILFSVGFSDESHFVRDFKRAYGLPPARYRASYLQAVFSSDLLSEQDSKIGQ
jgi:AraC family transcriptional regulator of arabinose operon